MLTDLSRLSPLERALTPFTRLRPGEGRSLAMFFVSAFLFLFSYYILKALREAFVLSEFSAAARAYSLAAIALLLMVIAFENLSGGMGTAAFVAFLMSLCNQRFTATQYALLSAFASVGRVWVGPLAGVLAESIGWPTFFIVSTLAALPALVMLWWLRAPVRALEVDPADAGRADD